MRAYSPTPVPHVVAPQWLGGLAAYAPPERPQVLIDGDYQKSPWVDPHRVERCGAIYLGPAALRAAGPDLIHGIWVVPSERPGRVVRELDYAIALPRGDCFSPQAAAASPSSGQSPAGETSGL